MALRENWPIYEHDLLKSSQKPGLIVLLKRKPLLQFEQLFVRAANAGRT
jgi:hypothetical protein